MCHSTRPSRKSNYTKANSLNQRNRVKFNRNSSLIENNYEGQSYIPTVNVNNNFAMMMNVRNNNYHTTKNNN